MSDVNKEPEVISDTGGTGFGGQIRSITVAAQLEGLESQARSQKTESTRRELLRSIGASLALGAAGAGLLSAQDAGHVHHMVTQERARGDYRPKCFTPHEYATLRRLAELIRSEERR